MNGSVDSAPDERSAVLAGRPWAAVVLLMLLIVVNYIDRFLPAILAEPIKAELGLSDKFLGLLNGLGFLAVYAVAGIPIARLADSGRYGAVISGAVALWSLMTSLGGFAATGWQLAASRVGVALGEAGSTPASHAYVSRHFPPAQRAGALAVLTLGVPLGTSASLALGGMVGEALGWRRAFFVMGAIGICIAPVVLAALGPGRPLPAAEAKAPRGVAAELAKPTILAIFAAVSLISMGGYSTLAFSPAFLMRTHGMTVGGAGLQLGLINGAIGVLGLLATGWIGARLARRDPRWTIGVLAILALACAPCGAAAYLVSDRMLAMALIGASFAISNTYLALTIACLHSLVPAAMRARTSAVTLFCSAFFGGLGPFLTGAISDALGPSGLGRALLVVPISYAAGALCYLAALRTFRRDLVESV